eukprot:scaffold7359_cov255-Pinguiococcus_pyrenoidosus.AAC.10
MARLVRLIRRPVRGLFVLPRAGGSRVLLGRLAEKLRRLVQHALLLGAEHQLVQLLRPHNAVHWLGRRGSDGADRMRLGWVVGIALVAFGVARQDGLNLPVVARGAALDQRQLLRDAHPIHVTPRADVVQRVEHEVEPLEVVQPKLLVLDVAMVRFDAGQRIEGLDGLARHHGLGEAHVLLAEQELPVQIGDVDGVQVDGLDALEATQHEVLQELAADASSSHDEHLGGAHRLQQLRALQDAPVARKV